jgi:hypothetical protein
MFSFVIVCRTNSPGAGAVGGIHPSSVQQQQQHIHDPTLFYQHQRHQQMQSHYLVQQQPQSTNQHDQPVANYQQQPTYVVPPPPVYASQYPQHGMMIPQNSGMMQYQQSEEPVILSAPPPAKKARKRPTKKQKELAEQQAAAAAAAQQQYFVVNAHTAERPEPMQPGACINRPMHSAHSCYQPAYARGQQISPAYPTSNIPPSPINYPSTHHQSQWTSPPTPHYQQYQQQWHQYPSSSAYALPPQSPTAAANAYAQGYHPAGTPGASTASTQQPSPYRSGALPPPQSPNSTDVYYQQQQMMRQQQLMQQQSFVAPQQQYRPPQQQTYQTQSTIQQQVVPPPHRFGNNDFDDIAVFPDQLDPDFALDDVADDFLDSLNAPVPSSSMQQPPPPPVATTSRHSSSGSTTKTATISRRRSTTTTTQQQSDELRVDDERSDHIDSTIDAVVHSMSVGGGSLLTDSSDESLLAMVAKCDAASIVAPPSAPAVRRPYTSYYSSCSSSLSPTTISSSTPSAGTAALSETSKTVGVAKNLQQPQTMRRVQHSSPTTAPFVNGCDNAQTPYSPSKSPLTPYVKHHSIPNGIVVTRPSTVDAKPTMSLAVQIPPGNNGQFLKPSPVSPAPWNNSTNQRASPATSNCSSSSLSDGLKTPPPPSSATSTATSNRRNRRKADLSQEASSPNDEIVVGSSYSSIHQRNRKVAYSSATQPSCSSTLPRASAVDNCKKRRSDNHCNDYRVDYDSVVTAPLPIFDDSYHCRRSADESADFGDNQNSRPVNGDMFASYDQSADMTDTTASQSAIASRVSRRKR